MTELLDYSDIVFNGDESLIENDDNSVVFGWATIESGYTNDSTLSGGTGFPLIPTFPPPAPSGAPTTIGPYYYPYVSEIVTYESLYNRLGVRFMAPIGSNSQQCLRYIDTANIKDLITNRSTAIDRIDTSSKTLTSNTTRITGRSSGTYKFDVMSSSAAQSYKDFAVDGSSLYKNVQVPPKSTLTVNFNADNRTFKISGSDVLSATTTGNLTLYICKSTSFTTNADIWKSKSVTISLAKGLMDTNNAATMPGLNAISCSFINTGTTTVQAYIRLRATCTATSVRTGGSPATNVATGTPVTTWQVSGSYKLSDNGDIVEGYDLVPLNACRTKVYNPKITLTRLGITQAAIAGVYGNYNPTARTLTTKVELYDLGEILTESSRTMTVSAVTNGSTLMITPVTVSGTTSLKRTTYDSYAYNQKLVLSFILPTCIMSTTASNISSFTRTLNYMMGATAHGLTYFTSGTCTQTMNRANAAGQILFTGAPETIQHTFLLPPSLGDSIEYKTQMQILGGVIANIGCSTAAVGEWEE